MMFARMTWCFSVPVVNVISLLEIHFFLVIKSLKSQNLYMHYIYISTTLGVDFPVLPKWFPAQGQNAILVFIDMQIDERKG